MSTASLENKTSSPRKGIYECPVLQIEEVARGIFLMRLSGPEISQTALPGQFVNIQARPEPIPLLRRPFSVCRANPVEGTFDLLWKAIGAGTTVMANSRKGDCFSVLGPLGKGFTMPAKNIKKAIIVAGGLGVAPMPLMLDHLATNKIPLLVLLGARSKDELWGEEIFESQGANLRFATDDGSAGRKGFVTELLREELQQQRDIEVYACGPMPMLAKVSEMCREAEISAQLSVETMMGCGFGICMGCPMTPAGGVKAFGRYLLACLDGPVFRAGEVAFGD